MPSKMQLEHPWFVAVWPGMGHVAISAGYYLMAKLGMDQLAEFRAEELFDVEHVEVRGGLVRTGRLPRSRLFLWKDPSGRHDIIVFVGEAQPPIGKYAFCRRLVTCARELGAERILTFAAMATAMHPAHPSRVYAAAADEETLGELKRLELEILEEGYIGGLNGILLGVVAEEGLRGACLLGEMPHFFAPLPFPKASLAVLETFTTMARIDVDLDELREQAQAMHEQVGEALAHLKRAMEEQQPTDEATGFEAPDHGGLSDEDKRRIDQLFDAARRDRSKAYELKNELDRLGVFKDYEDRFLDLFKKSD